MESGSRPEEDVAEETENNERGMKGNRVLIGKKREENERKGESEGGKRESKSSQILQSIKL